MFSKKLYKDDLLNEVRKLWLIGANIEDFTCYINDNSAMFNKINVFQTDFGNLKIDYTESVKPNEFVIIPSSYELGIKHCRCCGKPL